MARIKIPRVYAEHRVLLADDEPEHLDWLVEHLKTKGLETLVATNVGEALAAVQKEYFRAYFVDLNIPMGGTVPAVSSGGSTFEEYHGLYIIKLVRTQGNAGTRVIAYSAHNNNRIQEAVKQLYCTFVVKGRPRELKDEIERILKQDPVKKKFASKEKRKPIARMRRR